MNSIVGTVNWGIVGCGDVCEIKSGPAFNKVANSRLVAVMRRDVEKAEDYARRHGVPRFYSDVTSLLNDKDVNAIYIATPPVYHEEYTRLALQAGKPVYVEKPVAINAVSCARMIAFSKQYQGHVSVAHYRRQLPLFNKVKSLIQADIIGKVGLIRVVTLQPLASKIITQTEDQWRLKPELSGGGLFHDLSPHQLDIIFWIFGEPLEVTARSRNQSAQYAAPDVIQLDAVYAKNVCLQGLWAFNVAECAAQDKCEIIGDKGMLSFSFFKKSTLEVITDTGTESITLDYPENIQLPMIDAVTKFFRGEGASPCSLEEALVVMRMIDETLQT